MSVSPAESNHDPPQPAQPVLDLNRILLLLALLSPVVVLVRTAPRAALNRGWQSAAIIVLSVTVLAWIGFPRSAGYIGGGVWLLLLFLPAVGLRKEAELVVAERYGAARRVVSVLSWLHPVKTVRHELLFLGAMEAAQRGETEKAANLLGNLRSGNDRAGLQVIAQNYRIRGDWAGTAALVQGVAALGHAGKRAGGVAVVFPRAWRDGFA